MILARALEKRAMEKRALEKFLLFTEIPTEKMLQMQGWVEKI